MNGIKKWLLIISSVLLVGNFFLSLYNYGFTYIVLYLLYLLPAIFGLLYLKKQDKGLKIGVWLTSIIVVGIELLVFPAAFNVLTLILYIVLSISVI